MVCLSSCGVVMGISYVERLKMGAIAAAGTGSAIIHEHNGSATAQEVKSNPMRAFTYFCGRSRNGPDASGAVAIDDGKADVHRARFNRPPFRTLHNELRGQPANGRAVYAHAGQGRLQVGGKLQVTEAHDRELPG